MISVENCMYCSKDEKLHGLMIEMGHLSVSTLYLLKEQTYTGRCVVAYNRHQKELFELDEQELIAFSKDVSSAAKAISRAFNPDKLNYAIYGDLMPHLHVHLVPKYKDGDCWGKAFGSGMEYNTFLNGERYLYLEKQIMHFLE